MTKENIDAKTLASRAEKAWNAVVVNETTYRKRFGQSNIAVGEGSEDTYSYLDHDNSQEELKKRLVENYGVHQRFRCLGGIIDVFGKRVILYGTIDEIVNHPMFVVRRA